MSRVRVQLAVFTIVATLTSSFASRWSPYLLPGSHSTLDSWVVSNCDVPWVTTPPDTPYADLASTVVDMPSQSVLHARWMLVTRTSAPIDDTLAIDIARNVLVWSYVREHAEWRSRTCRRARVAHHARELLGRAARASVSLLERWSRSSTALRTLDESRGPAHRLASPACANVRDDERLVAYLEHQQRLHRESSAIVLSSPALACQRIREGSGRWTATRDFDAYTPLEPDGPTVRTLETGVEALRCTGDEATETDDDSRSFDLRGSDPHGWCTLSRQIVTELGATEFSTVLTWSNCDHRNCLSVLRHLLARVDGRWRVIATEALIQS